MQLSGAKWLRQPETQAIIKAFGNAPIRFVGGAVRDSLLGIEAKDVDAATPLLPQEVITLLEKHSIKAIPTGIDHGTITAVVGTRNCEITTLRRDVSTDGRRATVAYTTDWKEDAARRDFTINALYCDATGEISDYYNGISDLKAGHVRFIGNASERIKEDALRILRFFRFFTYYGKEPPDSEALGACEAQASSIDNLSGERIQQEMIKLLASAKSASTIALMQNTNILRHVIPHTVSTQTLERLSALLSQTNRQPDAILALATLLRSTDSEKEKLAQEIGTRWRLSKAHQQSLLNLCHDTQVAGDNKKHWQKTIRALGREAFIQHTLLTIAEGSDEKTGLKAMEYAETWNIPEFPLTGDDLIHHGIKPGKELGTLLKKLEEIWEEKAYTTDKDTLLRSIDSLKG